MVSQQARIQVGKNGFTQGVMENIKSSFKTHGSVKLCFLKSTGHTKEKVKETAERILEELGKNYTYRAIGFTIFLKKWRKDKR